MGKIEESQRAEPSDDMTSLLLFGGAISGAIEKSGL